MSNGLIKLIGTCLSAALLTACSTQVAPMTPQLGPAHALVLLGLNTGTKAGLNVSLSVGGASIRRFLLDTGSTGLWVYPNAIGNYSKTRYAVTNSYGSGLVYEGILVYTTVDFGNGLTTGKVPVALVQRATCLPSVTMCPATPNKHNCPGVKPGRNAGIRCLEVGRKLFGTFGAALLTKPVPAKQPVTELYNVLFGIAQPWAASFIVTPQAIEVGPYTTNGFNTMPMTLQSPAPAQPIPSGARGWSKGATLCFRVGRLRNYCIETTFDTGATSIDFLTAVEPAETNAMRRTRKKRYTLRDARTGRQRASRLRCRSNGKLERHYLARTKRPLASQYRRYIFQPRRGLVRRDQRSPRLAKAEYARTNRAHRLQW